MKRSIDEIDYLIGAIAAGKLDPDSAARAVLGIKPSGHSSSEEALLATGEPSTDSIGALIARFGPPPEAIELDWRRQIESCSREWKRLHPESPLPVRFEEWLVSDENRLSPPIPFVSDFGDRQLPDQRRAEAIEKRKAKQSEKVANPSRLGPSKAVRGGLGALGLIATALVGIRVYDSTRTSPARPSASDGEVTKRRGPVAKPAMSKSPAIDVPRPGLATQESSSSRLDRIESHADVMASGEKVPVVTSFDSLGALSQVPNPLSPDAKSPTADLFDLGTSVDAVQLLADDVAEDAGSLPSEREIEIQVESQVDAVALPAPSGNTAPLLLTPRAVNEIDWEFPSTEKGKIELRRISPDAWGLIDSANGVAIAKLDRSDRGIEFSWSVDAKPSPLAGLVPAGRLRFNAAGPDSFEVFLRPTLRPKALSLDLSDSDTLAAWSLQGPPLFQSPHWSVEFRPADGIIFEWIMPPDPSKVRRGEGIAQWRLTEADADAPVIRTHVESRIGARWTLRLRHAVLMSMQAGWEPFSEPRLTEALKRMTIALNQSLLEQSEMSRRYSAASASNRRTIKPTKDLLDQRVEDLQAAMKRLRQLETLTSALALTRLSLGLSTAWPDRRQVIFESDGSD